MLTSATRGEMLTPNPNECNSMLTSGTRGIYSYLYIAEESIPCAKFDINPFGEHNKTDSHPDDTDENIPFPPITQEEDLLGNQNSNKKRRLEGERVLGKKFSENELKACIESYLKALVKTQKNFIMIISKLEREGFTTRTRTGL